MDTEVQELVTALDGVKSTVVEMVRQIGDDGIAWSPDIENTNSAAVLVTHMFGSEAATIHEYIGGTPVNRDRDSEFGTDGFDRLLRGPGRRSDRKVAHLRR